MQPSHLQNWMELDGLWVTCRSLYCPEHIVYLACFLSWWNVSIDLRTLTVNKELSPQTTSWKTQAKTQGWLSHTTFLHSDSNFSKETFDDPTMRQRRNIHSPCILHKILTMLTSSFVSKQDEDSSGPFDCLSEQIKNISLVIKTVQKITEVY